jgi:predicted O-methyltransferase YrrM
MDARLATLLEDLHRHGVEHDAGKADRLERLRNLEPETAALLALLVRATGSRRVLELGTSNGYSTVWLADAVAANSGSLTSVELDPERTTQAAQNLAQAGLRAVVDLRIQDAADTLRQSEDDEWDMIFLDAERPAYTDYWPDLMRVLRPRGVLAVDNVLSHAAELVDFRALVSADERVSEALSPTGAGALLVVREADERVRR